MFFIISIYSCSRRRDPPFEYMCVWSLVLHHNLAPFTSYSVGIPSTLLLEEASVTFSAFSVFTKAAYFLSFAHGVVISLQLESVLCVLLGLSQSTL